MNKGLTLIEILIATTVLISGVVGGYLLFIKEDAVPTENIEAESSTPDTENNIVFEPSVQTNKEVGTNIMPEQEPVPEPEPNIGEEAPIQGQTSEPLPVIQTSPLWQGVIDSISSQSPPETEPTTEPTGEQEPEPELATPAPKTVTVSYSNGGFSPQQTTINSGDTVLFTNNSNHGMWVGSDNHPTHTGYPESTSGDCLGSSFDSCVEITTGSSWSFVFNSIGSWGYHNHTRVGKTGTVIVQ